MNRYLTAFAFVLVFFVMEPVSRAQTAQAAPASPPSKSSAQPGKMPSDSMLQVMFSKATYPLIKGSKWSGVIPVSNPTEIPDPNMKFKVVVELTTHIKDTNDAKEVSMGLAEIGRLINLYVASGIPARNIDMVVVAHGNVLYTMTNNDTYQKKYHMPNPNLGILNELTQAGVRFVACGQAMFFQQIQKEQLLPFVKVSLTAQTALVNYQLKGYVLKEVGEQD